MKRMLFVYNPNSGMGLLKPKLSDVIDTFVKGGYEVTVYPTQRSQDAVRKVSGYTEEYDIVACSGGDGTLDEVVTGMMMRENKTPIGYIPAGTTNDFASSLHISKNMLEAADTIVTGTPFSFDIGQFNDDYFVYIAAFGIFTDVSYETKQSMKNILGHMAYILEGTKRLFNIPSYKIKVTHDGETIEDEFIFGMVTNSRSVGGFKRITGENVIFDDGVFEVTLFKTPKNPVELNELLGAVVMRQINCIKFDSRYMVRAGRYSHRIVENKYFDVMKYSVMFFEKLGIQKDRKSVKLEVLVEKLNIENPRAHRALADAMTTAAVFLKLKEMDDKSDESNVDNLLGDIDAW